MKRTCLATAAAMVAGSMLLAPAAGRAQALQIDASVKDHLTMRADGGGVVHGDLSRQSAAAVEILAEPRRPALDLVATFKPAAERSGAVASNAALLFSSRHQVTLGNPEGDATLVEFFDYNCGFCSTQGNPKRCAGMPPQQAKRVGPRPGGPNAVPNLTPVRPMRRWPLTVCVGAINRLGFLFGNALRIPAVVWKAGKRGFPWRGTHAERTRD